MSRLEGKIALVTGAARGIGEGIALAFHQEGATVLLTDVRDDLGSRTAEDAGSRARYQRLDVRREEDWRSVVDGVLDRHGRLDVVVNNAGTSGRRTPSTLSWRTGVRSWPPTSRG